MTELFIFYWFAFRHLQQKREQGWQNKTAAGHGNEGGVPNTENKAVISPLKSAINSHSKSKTYSIGLSFKKASGSTWADLIHCVIAGCSDIRCKSVNSLVENKGILSNWTLEELKESVGRIPLLQATGAQVSVQFCRIKSERCRVVVTVMICRRSSCIKITAHSW